MPAPVRNLQLTWFNRQGEVGEKIPGATGEFSGMKVSPDGSKAAIVQVKVFAQQASISVIDFARGTNNRFTFGPGVNVQPVWSPDGQHVAWCSTAGGNTSIMQKAANGAGNEEVLFQVSGDYKLSPTNWSPAGRYLIFIRDKNLWALPVAPAANGSRTPIPLIQSPENKSSAMISPDDRWVAYLSSETGRSEVYVQGVNLSSSNTGKWVVSTGASGLLGWQADGKQLLYFSADGALMAVGLTGGPVFQPSPPQLLFKLPPRFLRLSPNPSLLAGATANHQRILMSMPVQESERQELSVILNWRPAPGK